MSCAVGFGGVCTGWLAPGGGAGGTSALIVIDSVAALDSSFPNVGGVYTIDKQTLWVSQSGAPIDLTGTGRSISLVHPGSIKALGFAKVAIIGDAAGPLVSGEWNVSNVTITNVNPAGSDALIESPSGRLQVLENVALSGENPGKINNSPGVARLDVLLNPSAPTAAPFTIDGTIGVIQWTGAAVSPGVGYVAIALASTAVVTIDARFDGAAFFGSSPTDYMLYLDPAATLPGGPPLPTNTFGVEVFGCAIKGGRLFDPSGLDQTDIRIISAQNTGGPDSQFIGDVIADTTVTPAPVPISQTHSLANTWEVVPSDNGPAAAPNDVILTETSVNERHTLTITSRQVWSDRYNGPEDQRTDVVAWEASARRSGGTAAIVSAQLEYNDGGGWLPLDETRDTISAGLSTTPTKISGRTVVNNNNGYELRLVSRTSAPATATLWDKFKISKGI